MNCTAQGSIGEVLEGGTSKSPRATAGSSDAELKVSREQLSATDRKDKELQRRSSKACGRSPQCTGKCRKENILNIVNDRVSYFTFPILPSHTNHGLFRQLVNSLGK